MAPNARVPIYRALVDALGRSTIPAERVDIEPSTGPAQAGLDRVGAAKR